MKEITDEILDNSFPDAPIKASQEQYEKYYAKGNIINDKYMNEIMKYSPHYEECPLYAEYQQERSKLFAEFPEIKARMDYFGDKIIAQMYPHGLPSKQ